MDAPNAPATTPDSAPKRRRNAAATRQAILESAREAFTRYGYDGVGLREIAQNAGVTAMLVNRYFGSKEKLFEEVVEASLAMPGILRNEIAKKPKDSAALSQALAAALTAKTADDGARRIVPTQGVDGDQRARAAQIAVEQLVGQDTDVAENGLAGHVGRVARLGVRQVKAVTALAVVPGDGAVRRF